MITNPNPELLIRQASHADIPEIVDLVIARKVESNPAQPDYETQQAQRFAEYGPRVIAKSIDLSINCPLQSFARVATIGGTVVGSAFAVAPPEEEYTVWKGLTTHPDFDGRGIGGHLEAARQSWARTVGRPVRAVIPESNKRSYDFFTARGFREIRRVEPTKKVPVAFREVELRWD